LAQNDRAMFVQVVASLTPRNAKLDVDLGTKPIYLIRDHPLTEDEWVAKYCDPDLKPSELQ
jgi:hypothetical protein